VVFFSAGSNGLVALSKRMPFVRHAGFFSTLALVGGARRLLIAEPEHGEQDLNITGRAQLRRLIGLAAAGHPGRKHRHVGRIEGHQVGAISGDELAEHMSETDRRRRIC